MIKVKNELIVSQNFQQAMAKLGQLRLPVKTAFDLKVMMNRIDQKIKDAHGVKNDLLKKYCELDEKGEFKRQMQVLKDKEGKEFEAPVPGSIVIIKETEKEFQEKFNEWKDYEHEIKGNKLTAESLGSAEVTAYELTLLEPFFNFPEEEKKNHLQSVK